SQKFNNNGRTALPKKFRSQLGNHLVLLQGYEQCLVLVSANALEQLVKPDQPFIQAAARETERFLLGNAYEIEPDSQGRFVIPSVLREYAQLQNEEIIFIGVGNRVELWDPAKWTEYQAYLNKNSADIANQLLNNQ